uniref:Uncharacterized protein n=1 Tax=Sphaerodactylus townsendi TaxID=933632 RepID=A0ACB8FN44_9SAUR
MGWRDVWRGSKSQQLFAKGHHEQWVLDLSPALFCCTWQNWALVLSGRCRKYTHRLPTIFKRRSSETKVLPFLEEDFITLNFISVQVYQLNILQGWRNGCVSVAVQILP